MIRSTARPTTASRAAIPTAAPSAAAALLAALGLLLALAVPAEGQRPRKTTSKTASPATAPLAEATAARRSGESAERTAVLLARAHGMETARVAGTLLRAGYPARDVGRALEDELRRSPGRSFREIRRAGVEEVAAYSVLLSATGVAPALRALVENLDRGRALAVVRRAEPTEGETSAEEQAEAMDQAGYTVEEILATLMEHPWGLDAHEALIVLLKTSIGAEAEAFAYLRERALTASDGLAAALEAGWDAATAVDVLEQAGYAWDAIADALKWSGRSLDEVVLRLREGGATTAEVVGWAVAKGTVATETLLQALVEAGDDPLDVARALLDEEVSLAEVAEAARAAGASIRAIVEVLHESGASPGEIADVLRAMGVGLTTFVELMVSVVGLSAQAAAALFGG